MSIGGKMIQVLVVEDDPRIRRMISLNLTARSFSVQEASDGLEAIALMSKRLPDVALVDLVMPNMDGIELCRWIRERSQLPIIIISAQDKEEMKVRALDLGADDYVTKPVGVEELMARIRAVQRRLGQDQAASSGAATAADDQRLDLDGLIIDLKARRAFAGKEDIRLTRTEFALITELARHADEILSHDHLLSRVWGPEYRGSSHYLHVYLGRIRTKLGSEYSSRLETISGMGYILHSSDPRH
jgi:two-component system, OmpR family, KDP operon response regulator KdpE